MNAVDRFSSTLARYRQQPQLVQAGVNSVQQPSTPVIVPQPLMPPPATSRSEVDKALDKFQQVTPMLSRLAALVNRVQQPATTVQAYPGVPIVQPSAGPLGQSLQRLGQAVGDKGVDQFVRTAAPVIDDAIPFIEDVVNLFSGKPVRPVAQPGVVQPYGAQAAAPSISQQVAPMVDGVTSLVSGVSSLVNAIGGLFK